MSVREFKSETIGAFVWWDAANLTVEPHELRRILTDHGFTDVAEKVPDIDPGAGIRRAAREWGQGRGNADRYRAEVNVDDGARVVVGVLGRWQSQETSGWKQVETFTFDVSSGTWATATSSKFSDQASDFIRLASDRMRYHDHVWIRPRFIMDQLEQASAITLRSRGGFYFVANEKLDLIDRMGSVLNAIGPNSMSIARIQGDEVSRQSIAVGLRDSIAESISEVHADLEKWVSSTRKIRTDSQNGMFSTLQQLLARADLYEEALGIQLTELRSRVQEAQDRAMQILAAA